MIHAIDRSCARRSKHKDTMLHLLGHKSNRDRVWTMQSFAHAITIVILFSKLSEAVISTPARGSVSLGLS